MQERVEVAAVQMNLSWLDPEKNLEKMLSFLEVVHSEKDVDLVVFPELANTGYVKERDKEFGKEYIKKSEKIPGPFTDGLRGAAREYGFHIISGFCELHHEVPQYRDARLLRRYIP
jgi:predicted amidohydrolase